MSEQRRGVYKGRGRQGSRREPEVSQNPRIGRGRSSSLTSLSETHLQGRGDELKHSDIKSDIQEQTSKMSALKLGEGDSAQAGEGSSSIGRGGSRKHKIATGELVQMKPSTCMSKKGTFGDPVKLQANYFTVKTMADWVLYQYRVDFNIEEERESVKKAWLREHNDRLTTAYIFDGTLLYTSQRLTADNSPLELVSLRESDKFPVQITIRFVQQLSHGNAVYLQIFNILLRRCLTHLDLRLVNRNYFDPKSAIHLPHHHMSVWPGYVTSIRQHENSVLMCADISHKIMRTDTAFDILSECSSQSTDFQEQFSRIIVGTVVLTDYNNKTYRIDDVDFSQSPLSKFKYRNDQEITFLEYYRQRYQIKIKDLKQPLLVSRASAKDLRAGLPKHCLLIPELCRMTGLTSKMIDNRNLMKDLSDITRLTPDNRIEKLRDFNRRLREEEAIIDDFGKWGLELDTDLATVTAREFPPENIISGKSKTFSSGTEVDWSRNVRSAPMLKVGKINQWVVICPSRLRRETEEFLLLLKKVSDGMDFYLPKPIVSDTPTDNPPDLLEAVERAVAKYNPDLIMFVFTSDRGDRYSAVKKKCYVDRGIVSQVVLSKTMRSKNVMSIASKIAIQLNCKIGGAPWTIRIPAENIMVVGYDVCRGTGQKSSVGAVVASLDQAMSSWYSAVSHHSDGEELSDYLSIDVCKAVRKYYDCNSRTLPKRIIVYRDGVGEGQLDHVYNHEVVMLKKRLSSIYGGESWRLAYIIVTKRINTKFFNEGKNPRPGTLVDDVFTLPNFYDFYLVSQSVRQGTVSPTQYNVISDNLGWGPNHIQRLTYKMTHLYYNWSSTVRVPAPCQYAHKLAFMVNQYIHRQPHPNLETRLYFL